MTEHPETISEYWVYPLRYGQTLSSNEGIEWKFHSFLTSRFVTYAVHENRRAEAFTAVLLWSESYRQDPAGTLPDDDVELMALARITSMDEWRAMRARVLYGWKPCTIEDEPGARRLGHRVIAKIASDSWRRKAGRAQSREGGKIIMTRHRVKKQLVAMNSPRLADQPAVVEAVAAWLLDGGLNVNRDNVAAGLEAAAGVPRVVDGGFGRSAR